MASNRKRKVDAECRSFKDEWTQKYFFILFKDKPLCLICNETVSVVKEFNIQRHFKTKHGSSMYASLSEEDIQFQIESLSKQLRSQQNLFKQQDATAANATKASYMIAHKIAKSNKTFGEGEFVKDCLQVAADVLCPDKKKLFESISLSRRTITTRIEKITENITSQLKEKIKSFVAFSITMDESTDISDTAQLLIFVRGIDDKFNVTEELASLKSIKGTTTGRDIYSEFEKCLNLLHLPPQKLINITTDGAPNMVGTNQGFVGIFNEKYPDNNVIFLHCVIHQEALCKAALEIKHVLDIVVKVVNTIRARGLTHRQFQEFLASIESDYSDLLYYNKVRWLSAGQVFERVWQLKNEIIEFLRHKEKLDDSLKLIEDPQWMSDFAFFTDLLGYLIKLNKSIQGKNLLLDYAWAQIKAFKLKLRLFSTQICNRNLTHFPKLQTVAQLTTEKVNFYVSQLNQLENEFNRRFEDFKKIEGDLQLFSSPFAVNCEDIDADYQLELIELQCNDTLKQMFNNSSKLDFYKSLSKSQFPNLTKHAQKIISMFGSSYICEQVFSTMNLRKNKLRNKMTDEHLECVLRISSSNLEPNFNEMIKEQSKFHMSHGPSTSKQ